jgi:hypothetical protein
MTLVPHGGRYAVVVRGIRMHDAWYSYVLFASARCQHKSGRTKKQTTSSANTPSMARLSLAILAAFFFLNFLKSFASGQESGYGFAWYNLKASSTDCTYEDVAIVDNAVEEMFYEVLNHPLDDWISLASTRRDLRGRELCTGHCINRCNDCQCMCYGMCQGCGTRSLFTSDRELFTKEKLEDYCAMEVQALAKAKPPRLTDSCAKAVKKALCEVTL